MSFKDSWQTPKEVFYFMDNIFNFTLDAAASESNFLCANYLSPEQNALTKDWITTGSVWCNPPYSNIMPWVKCAADQIYAKTLRGQIVMLLPADSSTAWFKEALKTASEIKVVTGGRLSFINPETKKETGGNTKGSLFFIWTQDFSTPARTTYIDRDTMLFHGKEIISRNYSCH